MSENGAKDEPERRPERKVEPSRRGYAFGVFLALFAVALSLGIHELLLVQADFSRMYSEGPEPREIQAPVNDTVVLPLAGEYLICYEYPGDVAPEMLDLAELSSLECRLTAKDSRREVPLGRMLYVHGNGRFALRRFQVCSAGEYLFSARYPKEKSGPQGGTTLAFSCERALVRPKTELLANIPSMFLALMGLGIFGHTLINRRRHAEGLARAC